MRDSYDPAVLLEHLESGALYIEVSRSPRRGTDSSGQAETVWVKHIDEQSNVTWKIAMQKPIPNSISTDTEGDDQ